MPSTSPDPTWLLLQLTDSAFPVGSFAHSGGLEAAWQLGDVPSAVELSQFLRAAQLQAASLSGPIVAAIAADPSRYTSLDRFYDATLTNHVANRASRTQGQSLLATAGRVFAHPGLIEQHKRLRTDALPGHLPATFGLIYGTLGVSVEHAVSCFLFLNLRSLISAAVRLGIVGPIEAQAMQLELSADAPKWVSRTLSCKDVEAEVAQTSPMLDFYQALQDQLYSRLFVS